MLRIRRKKETASDVGTKILEKLKSLLQTSVYDTH